MHFNYAIVYEIPRRYCQLKWLKIIIEKNFTLTTLLKDRSKGEGIFKYRNIETIQILCITNIRHYNKISSMFLFC